MQLYRSTSQQYPKLECGVRLTGRCFAVKSDNVIYNNMKVTQGFLEAKDELFSGKAITRSQPNSSFSVSGDKTEGRKSKKEAATEGGKTSPLLHCSCRVHEEVILNID